MQKKVITLSFKTDSATKTAIEEIAIQEDRSMSYIINSFLQREIENYRKTIGTPSSKAEKVIQYIEETNFESFGEFVRIATKEGKYTWVSTDMGWHMAYHYICAKLHTQPDAKTLESLQELEVEY